MRHPSACLPRTPAGCSLPPPAHSPGSGVAAKSDRKASRAGRAAPEGLQRSGGLAAQRRVTARPGGPTRERRRLPPGKGHEQRHRPPGRWPLKVDRPRARGIVTGWARPRATGKAARWCLAAWAPSGIESGPSGTRPRTSPRPAPSEPEPYELSGKTAKMCHRRSVTYRHVRHAKPELARSGSPG
jgi:hypothetical protein